VANFVRWPVWAGDLSLIIYDRSTDHLGDTIGKSDSRSVLNSIIPTSTVFYDNEIGYSYRMALSRYGVLF
jgi:hypothetical protein